MKQILALAVLACSFIGCIDAAEQRRLDGDKRANTEAQTLVVVCVDVKYSDSEGQIDAHALRDLPDHEVVSRKEIYRGGSERYSGKQNVVSGEDGNYTICYEVMTRRKGAR